MPRGRDRELAGVAPRARHAKGDGNHRAGRLRQRAVRASRRGHHFLTLGRQVHGHAPTGPDGALHDYEIAYTFGVYPLQQYLIAFPGGRYQALGIAWDSRPKDQGGQRWFHLYPDQKLQARRPAALDRARPDLELPVRRLPLDRSAEELQSRHRHLCNHLDRCRRGLRGVPRPRLAARRLGQLRRRRQLPRRARTLHGWA